jgi:hypothetical protein
VIKTVLIFSNTIIFHSNVCYIYNERPSSSQYIYIYYIPQQWHFIFNSCVIFMLFVNGYLFFSIVNVLCISKYIIVLNIFARETILCIMLKTIVFHQLIDIFRSFYMSFKLNVYQLKLNKKYTYNTLWFFHILRCTIFNFLCIVLRLIVLPFFLFFWLLYCPSFFHLIFMLFVHGYLFFSIVNVLNISNYIII